MTDEEKAAAAEVEAKAKAEAEAKAKAEAGSKMSDNEAALLKEVMEKKAKLKEAQDQLAQFKGVDLVKYQAMQKAEAEAEAKRAADEKKRLEQEGQWERLREQIVAENTKALDEVRAQVSAKDQTVQSLQSQIVELTIGAAFANSKVISDELTLTPRKTRAIYGSHFEVKDGEVVAFDKPAGASARTPLVDGQGKPVSFEVALKKLVDADPDRDSILKAKLKPGSGGNNGPAAAAPTTKAKNMDGGLSKIKAGLPGLLGIK